MSGIRLHHPLYRAEVGKVLTYVVELPAPYLRSGGYNCPDCGKQHANKAIHLRLDANGDVTVSKQIYESLQTIPTMAGLEFQNEVAKPPPLAVGAVAQEKRLIVEAPLNKDHATEHYAPGRTQYESRDRMEKAMSAVLTRPKKKGKVK